MENKPVNPNETPPVRPKEKLLWGIASLVFGLALFGWFYYSEQNGGAVTLPVWLILLYKLLGKWGVLAIFGGLGLLGIRSGLLGLWRDAATDGRIAATHRDVIDSSSD